MKKSFVLVLVWGIAIMISLLALGAIYLMGNQALLSEHRLKRMKAYYTAKAGMVHALEELRSGNLNPGTVNLNDMQADIVVGSPDSTNCRPVTITVKY